MTAAGSDRIDVEQIERDALVRRARERLVRIEDIHAAHSLAALGKTQRQIADALHTTQPRVHRMLKVVLHHSDGRSPEELILRATADSTDRKELVRALSRCHYTFREHAPEPFEGATRGSWDEVRSAFVAGMLSKDEFERVRSAVKPPTS